MLTRQRTGTPPINIMKLACEMRANATSYAEYTELHNDTGTLALIAVAILNDAYPPSDH